MNKKIIIIGSAFLLVALLVIVYLTDQNNNPAINRINPTTGNPNAKVTLVEFSDFECPYCGEAHNEMVNILAKYKNDIKFVFKQFPLPAHPDAYLAAEASECANDQGKFWEYYDLLFTNQDKLQQNYLLGYAKTLNLNQDQFTQCLTSHVKKAEISADIVEGNKLNIKGTPSFFLNGQEVADWRNLDQLISDEIKKQ